MTTVTVPCWRPVGTARGKIFTAQIVARTERTHEFFDLFAFGDDMRLWRVPVAQSGAHTVGVFASALVNLTVFFHKERKNEK